MSEVSKEVAGKFVNAGFQRVTELCHVAYVPEDTADFIANTGEVLRLLSKIVERLQEDATPPPLIPAIQDAFITALCTRLAQVKDALVSDRPKHAGEDQSHPASHCAIFLSRLLQFDLGFPGALTAQGKDSSEDLCETILQLILLHGNGSGLDVVAFPLLLDTLYYVLDETPADPRTTTFDPFRNYPDLELSQLPLDMPLEYRARIRTLLPYVSLNLAVVDLAYASRDASGSQILTQPVQNRPWEWTEYLGDVPAGEAMVKGEDRPEERGVVKNSASLALELFGARLTADRIVRAGGDPMAEGTARTLQDGLFSESVFMRDWRETRIMLDDEMTTNNSSKGEIDEDDGIAGSRAHQYQNQGPSERLPSSRRASPALSNRSARTSAHPSAPSSSSSLRQSPAQQQHPLSRLPVSTTSDVIDVDTFDLGATVGSTKRKAGSSVASDDVEGAIGASKTAKKPRAKSKAKKR